MKKILKILIVAFLLLSYIYVCKIESIPNKLILYKDDNIEFNGLPGLTLKLKNEDSNSILTSASSEDESSKATTNTAEIKLFNIITIKEIPITTLDETKVIPVGEIVGMKLYTKGILVVRDE